MKNQATHQYQIGDLIDFKRDGRYDVEYRGSDRVTVVTVTEWA